MADDKGRIYISHPDVEVFGKVTRRAFESVWAAKGWREVSDEEGLAAESALLLSATNEPEAEDTSPVRARRRPAPTSEEA